MKAGHGIQTIRLRGFPRRGLLVPSARYQAAFASSQIIRAAFPEKV
jgi:hypothetical protein